MPLWPRLRCFAWANIPAWPIVAPLVAYLYLLISNDQLQDALLGAAQDWSPVRDNALWFYAWTLVFALSLWFWGRMLLGFIRPIPVGLPPVITPQQVHQSVAAIITWLPRIVGALVPIGAATALLIASYGQPDAHPTGLVIGLALVLIIYSVIVLARRRVARRLSRNATPSLANALQPQGPVPTPPTILGTLRALTPIGLFFAVVWFAASVAASVWSVKDPVSMGHSFGGAVSIVPIGLAAIATGLALAVLLTMTYHVPVFAGLLALAVLSSYTMDNHQLNTLGDAAPAPTLQDAYRAFKPTPQRKLLLVATAGGGIRAAYWTAYALSSLHDQQNPQQKQFDNALFAISGVSGGSYGAVVYRAMLATNQPTPCTDRRSQAENTNPAKFADCVYLYLGFDGLGPTVVSLLFPDLQQRFIPVRVFSDRAHALELTWQQGWAERAPDDSRELLKNPFYNLWKDATPLPILLLNGTSVRAGHRIITANITPGTDAAAFHDVVFFDSSPTNENSPSSENGLTNQAIAATTAATNSARFPVISPPGTILDKTAVATDQIVDGGLFENSGAQTLLELYTWLINQSPAQPPDIGVLQITSDPDQPDPAGICGQKVTQGAGISKFLPDLLSPIETLLATRSARGTAEVQALQARVQADYVTRHPGETATKAPYFAIRLSRKDAPAFAPLGWQLSGAAVQTIQAAWTADCNKSDLDRLRAWLGINTSQ